MVIQYSYSEITSVEIASFRCPVLRKLTRNLFFLGSLHNHEPGLIAFMKIPPFVEIFPDAVITGLNRQGVIEKKSESMVAPTPRRLGHPVVIENLNFLEDLLKIV